MEANKIKHLEFIQATITRMNQNSFQIKGWMITIVPVIVFWMLDAYYLQQERKVRGIYNDVAGISPEASNMVIRDFEMPIQKYQCGKYCYFNVLGVILPDKNNSYSYYNSMKKFKILEENIKADYVPIVKWEDLFILYGR